MTQGTTPTLLFKFSFDLQLAKEWRIVFYQDEETNFVKTQADCIVDENQVIYIKLTQAETLAFDVNKYLKIQAKALTNDNNVISSDILTTHIHIILDKALFEVENTPPTIIDTSVIEFTFNKEHCQFGIDFEDLYIEQVGTGGGADITVDKELSLTSTNPVQNKVITQKIQEIQSQLKNGVSIQKVEQTTTSTEDNGINIITVTLSNGTKTTFEVRNGSKGSKGDKGEQGVQGADGYTPVKGKDYFTIEDVQNIVNQVIATLPIEQEVNDSTKPVSSVGVKNEFKKFSNAYDGIIKQAVVTQEYFDNDTVLIVENNKDYHANEDISSLDMRISSISECICSVTFKIVDSGDFNIGILGCTGYIGKAPDFKNGETWELSIHNGIVVGGKVE